MFLYLQMHKIYHYHTNTWSNNRERITKLGAPERMHSNQSRSFENQIIKQLCLLYQVKKSKMTLYHPRGNSQVECFNRSMKEKKMDWPLTGIGICTPHSTTSYTPYYLFLGMMPGYQWIIYFIPQVIEALVLMNGFNFITIGCRKLWSVCSSWFICNLNMCGALRFSPVIEPCGI